MIAPRVKKQQRKGQEVIGVVPVLGEVAILGGYLECVVVYVVEMQ